MRQFKFLPAATLLAGSFLFCSCNDNGKKEDSTAVTTDTSAMTTAPKMEPAAKPGNLLIIRHKVANYAKWKVAYDSHDSVRLVYGLHNYFLARGTKDSNTVRVVLRMDDSEKAKEFTAMPGLKVAMQKGGVIGTPKFLSLDVQWADTVSANGPSRVIMTHAVKDWDAWKKSFDSHKQTRIDAGLTDRALGYTIGDQHTVTVAFVISDMTKAEAFMNSKDLKDKMAEAGVTSAPDSFFYTVVQKY
ncbi:MAG: hypothetical protein ABIY51_13570 [Ferruginibacter sp.]